MRNRSLATKPQGRWRINSCLLIFMKGMVISMTKKQKEIIADNLRAYENNFGYIKIVKEDYGKGFYVFTSEERAEQGSWTQYCYNIDYLNGWLYGCVQAANGIMKKIDRKE